MAVSTRFPENPSSFGVEHTQTDRRSARLLALESVFNTRKIRTMKQNSNINRYLVAHDGVVWVVGDPADEVGVGESQGAHEGRVFDHSLPQCGHVEACDANRAMRDCMQCSTAHHRSHPGRRRARLSGGCAPQHSLWRRPWLNIRVVRSSRACLFVQFSSLWHVVHSDPRRHRGQCRCLRPPRCLH